MDDLSPASQYEVLKRRNWNSFLKYLENRHKPPLKLSQCTGHDVVEFLRYLDRFGKTKVHSDHCLHFGTTASNLLDPPSSCSCPPKQSWGFLDSVVGRLRAAYEEEAGGRSESHSNPFAHKVVTLFLEDVKLSQEKAMGTSLSKKKNSNKRKNPSPTTADDAVEGSNLKAKRKSLVAANVSARTAQGSGAVQSSNAIVDMPDGLPFKVGQLAESTSFEEGFRGAWFRCKLKSISWEKDQIGYTAEYYDFPDEEEKWAKLYEVAPYDRILTKCLMVRPQYPPMYHESKMPHVNSISETVIIVKGAWKVENLVDWHEKDCYWPARITQVFDGDKVQLELPMPPTGEGGSYEAYGKDLRPSLDWTPEHGWRLPLQEGGVSCARLIHPLNQGLKEKLKGKDNIMSQSEGKPISSQVGCHSHFISGSNEFMIKESKKMMKGKGNILSASEGKSISSKVGHQSYFTSSMTPYNIKIASLYIPANFAKANDLSKRSCEVLMRDDQQRMWTASIKQKTNGVCLRGWRNFQVANDVKEGDVYRIELLEQGEKPVLHFHYLQNKPIKAHDKAKITMISTSNRHPCFISTLKAYNFNKSLLHLPQEFARANGLGDGEMILKNVYQESWTVELRDVGRYIYVASGWSDFRVANELKEGDSFKFELIENGKKPVANFYRLSYIDQNSKVPSDGQAGTRSHVCASLSSRISANSEPVPLEGEGVIVLSEEDVHQTEQVEALDINVGDESVFSKASLSESMSTSHVQEFTTGEEGGCSSHESMTTGGTIKLNSMHNNTLEAAILDLEELANKVKWINAVLNYKNRFCNGTRSLSWKFVEHP